MRQKNTNGPGTGRSAHRGSKSGKGPGQTPASGGHLPPFPLALSSGQNSGLGAPPPGLNLGGPSVRPQVGAPVILETPGYQIRSLRPHDGTATFLGWLADPDLMWGLNIDTSEWSIDTLQNFILSFDNRQRYLIGIFCKVSRAMIGFYRLDVSLPHRIAHFAVGIGDRAYWGRNVLVETTPALLDHLFAVRAIEKVAVRILPSNRRILFNFMNSRRFFYEGRLTSEVRDLAGARHDVLCFAALKTPREAR